MKKDLISYQERAGQRLRETEALNLKVRDLHKDCVSGREDILRLKKDKE